MATRGGGWGSDSGVDPQTGLRALVDRVERAHRAAIAGMGVAAVRQIKIELSKPGTGRVYLRQSVRAEAGGRVRTLRSGRFASRSTLLRLDKQGRVRNAASGRFVTKSGKNRHVASAPGNPPAVDTGLLRTSIGMEIEDRRGSVRVGTATAYAAPLEFGTPRIQPRPFMQPALAKLTGVFSTLITTALRRAGPPV